MDNLATESLQTTREYTKAKVKKKISKFMGSPRNNAQNQKPAQSGRYEKMDNELKRHLDAYIC